MTLIDLRNSHVRPDLDGPPPTLRHVLVVGGAGFVGSVLVPRLLERGHDVTVMDALVYGDDGIADLYGHPRFQVVQGDCRSIEAIVRSMRKADAVVHLGGLVGDPACALDEKLTLEINLEATRTLLMAARGFGVKRFVFASSCSLYGANAGVVDEASPLAPVSVYASSKMESEELLLANSDGDTATVVLRFGTFYGLSPRPRFDIVVNLLTAKAVCEGRITVFGGEQWRPFVHVSDGCDAIIRCLDADPSLVAGQVFNVGSDDQNLSVAELARLVAGIVPGAEVSYEKAAPVEANYRVSFNKIEERLGFRAARSIADGVAEIKEAIESGSIDYTEARYSNHQSLMSGDAVDRLRTQTWLVTSPVRATG